MKKLLSFVIVTLMIVSAVIPAFALSEAPATPNPAENHINVWIEDAQLDFDPDAETNTVDVYVSISDNTDGFQYMKFIIVYPNCLTLKSMGPAGFTTTNDLTVGKEMKTVTKQFRDSLSSEYDPYEVLGIETHSSTATGDYKWASPYLEC